jgi:hypothetical protein
MSCLERLDVIPFFDRSKRPRCRTDAAGFVPREADRLRPLATISHEPAAANQIRGVSSDMRSFVPRGFTSAAFGFNNLNGRESIRHRPLVISGIPVGAVCYLRLSHA